jgi:hypothetical protein
VFLPCEASLVLLNQARTNEFKDIFASLNTGEVLAEILSPQGHYLVVDSFVERLDSDLSNNAGRLGVKELPRAFGLYLDGNRIAALPRDGQPDTAYFAATLDALPYRLRPGARTLLLGAAGGFRVHEALGAGASARGVGHRAKSRSNPMQGKLPMHLSPSCEARTRAQSASREGPTEGNG